MAFATTAALIDNVGSFIQSLFENKLINDERESIYEFTLFGGEEKFGLFAPDAELWKQLIIFILLQIPSHCFFAAIIYKFIISSSGRGSSFSYLLGWGIIIPTVILMPYQILEYLNIQNKIVKLAATNFMANVLFRCIEAMYDTSPNKVVETSIYHYMAYYTTGVSFIWDEKTLSRQKISISKVLSKLFWLLIYVHILSLHLSFLMYYNYKPFKNDDVELDQFHLSLDLFKPQHFANGYLHCLLTYLVLYIGFEGVAFSENVKGYDTKPIFNNPLFASRSPTEFWTKRWNTMTHSSLKNGIFRPARKYMNSKVALFLTFIMSGVYHDYSWSLVFYHQSHYYDDDGNCHKGCFIPVLGQLTAFFLYTGVVMLLERPLGKLLPFKWISNNLPTVVISTLMVLIHVPFSHWYYGDWIEGGYFSDFAIGLWHIKKIMN